MAAEIQLLTCGYPARCSVRQCQARATMLARYTTSGQATKAAGTVRVARGGVEGEQDQCAQSERLMELVLESKSGKQFHQLPKPLHVRAFSRSPSLVPGMKRMMTVTFYVALGLAVAWAIVSFWASALQNVRVVEAPLPRIMKCSSH